MKASKNGKSPKSSPEARRLIRAALGKYKSQRKAALALRLPSAMQLNRMLHGTMRDSPAMRAALVRAKKRAQRAYLMMRSDYPEPLDLETVRSTLREIDERIALLKQLTKPIAAESGNHEKETTPESNRHRSAS